MMHQTMMPINTAKKNPAMQTMLLFMFWLLVKG